MTGGSRNHWSRDLNKCSKCGCTQQIVFPGRGVISRSSQAEVVGKQFEGESRTASASALPRMKPTVPARHRDRTAAHHPEFEADAASVIAHDSSLRY